MLTLKTFSIPVTPSTINIETRIDVDFNELQQYIIQEFEKIFGESIVAEVEMAKYSPHTIDVTVYVKEKKEGMWPLCIKIADEFRNRGIRIGIHTELAKEVLNEV